MRLIISLLLSCLSFFTSAQKGQTPDVLFDVDRYELTSEARAQLNDIVNYLKSDQSIISVQLIGHTDSDASNEYNKRLSENRVKTVMKYLLNQGITQEIAIEFRGEENPLNENANEGEKRINRRVEIILLQKEEEIIEEGDIRELYRILEQKKQSFCIAPKGDTTIRLDQGTIIYIPPFAFGEREEKCIIFRAKEFYKKSDMVLENLSTTSNGSLLESEGMIYIEALADDEQISLAPDKELTIYMPTNNTRDDVGIFYGDRDAHTDIMNWATSNVGITGLEVGPITNCFTPNPNMADNIECRRCKFFMCRIARVGKGIKGMFNAEQREDNRFVRQCQRAYRRIERGDNSASLPTRGGTMQNQSIDSIGTAPCAQLDSLMAKFGVDNVRDLLLAMNKDLMEKYGVSTLEELRAAIEAQKLRDIEIRMEGGNATMNEMSYYMFNTRKLGWINIDAFSKLAGARKDMLTDLKHSSYSDCKAVFKNVRGILPAQEHQTHFWYFGSVPMNNSCWVVGLKYINKQAYLSLEETKTTEKYTSFKFRSVSPDELKEALKVLD